MNRPFSQHYRKLIPFVFIRKNESCSKTLRTAVYSINHSENSLLTTFSHSAPIASHQSSSCIHFSRETRKKKASCTNKKKKNAEADICHKSSNERLITKAFTRQTLRHTKTQTKNYSGDERHLWLFLVLPHRCKFKTFFPSSSCTLHFSFAKFFQPKYNKYEFFDITVPILAKFNGYISLPCATPLPYPAHVSSNLLSFFPPFFFAHFPNSLFFLFFLPAFTFISLFVRVSPSLL